MVDVPTQAEFDALAARVEMIERDAHKHTSALPDPKRDGFILAHAANISTADDETLNVGVHEGEPHGVTLIAGELVFDLRDGDRAWKGTKGQRAEITFGGATPTVGVGQVARYVSEFRIDPDSIGTSDRPSWRGRTLFQTHSTSGAPQHSPMFGVRGWDGHTLVFARENEHGKVLPIGDRIEVPLSAWLHEEAEIYMSPSSDGYAIYRLHDAATGAELDVRRYEGPTLLKRASLIGTDRDYSASAVRAYPKWGIYGQPMKYRRRTAAVYVRA